MYDKLTDDLEDLLDELKVTGDVYITFTDRTGYNWHVKYVTKVKGTECTFQTEGRELTPLIREVALFVERAKTGRR